MSLGPGTRLGPYEILSAVGAGGMGEVYKARDIRLERTVAIKVLPTAFSSDPERLARFEQEARATAALNHPNILAVHDVGTLDGSPYIVSELLEGETLRQKIRNLPLRKTVDYATQIAQGLAAAHEKGIVHRDLKPENVFITTDDRIKILDFGLAKLTQAEPITSAGSLLPTTPIFPAPAQTIAGVVLGTVGYMAPEQVRGVMADHRADIFAFGAILYEMLSGHRAFQGETAMDTMMAIAKEPPADLAAGGDRHPPIALTRIADRCLEKNVASRFQSARDLTFALEGASLESSIRHAPVPTRSLITRRERIAWITASIFLVVAIASTVALLTSGAQSPPGELRLQIVTPPDASLTAFSLSPDGKNLVYRAGNQLWLRPLQSENAQPIPGTDGQIGGAIIPFWSPDSRSLAFFSDHQLKKIELTSGVVQALAPAPNAAGGSWSTNGTILFAPSPSSALVRVSVGGGQRADATRLDPPRQVSHRFPQFLPDGRHFLFLSMGPAGDRGIYVGTLDSLETHRLFDADGPAVFALPDLVLFSNQGALQARHLDLETLGLVGDPIPIASRVVVGPNSFNAVGVSATSRLVAYRPGDESRQLEWVDRGGRSIATVGGPDDGHPQLGGISPLGGSMTVSRTVGGNTDIWVVDLERGIPRRLTSDPVRDARALWSPDGTRVLFNSERTGVFDLFERHVDGPPAERPMVTSTQPKIPLDYSPDGHYVVYVVQDREGANDLWYASTSGEPKPVALTQTPFDEINATFSPDGRWIAYQSDEGGGFQIYIQQFPSGSGKVQISTDGGTFPQWRHDERELFYFGSDNRVAAVPISIERDAIRPGRATGLFAVRPPVENTGPPFLASQDGQRFIVSTVTAEAAPITVLMNWAAAGR